jgi:hypothetical protein
MAVAEGRIRGAIDAQIENLSPRDRKLLLGLVAFVSIVGFGFLLLFVRGAVDDKASRVRTAKDNLEMIEAMTVEYVSAAEKVKRGEERLERFGNESLSAYIERVAREKGLEQNLTGVSPQDSEVVGSIRQTGYRVDMKKIPLESALDFVYEIETSGYPLSVELARFKTVMQSGEKVIDLTLDLVAYQLEKNP